MFDRLLIMFILESVVLSVCIFSGLRDAIKASDRKQAKKDKARKWHKIFIATDLSRH